MPGTFSHDQTVFSISLMANLGSALTGTVEDIEAELLLDIKIALQKYKSQLGSWQVVWGPGVYQSIGSNRAENAMFVARDIDDPSQIIVAIAGTNPYSAFDWLIEDVAVSTQVAWEYGNPPPGLLPRLALGTHFGLSVLQSLRPGPGLPGNSTTLQAFLQNLPPSPVVITTAGHSLGGAVSPVTALWLSDMQNQWDPTGRAKLFCFPSAGPTPGNQDFTTYYAASPLGNQTTRIHNQIDVVPHAWAASDLALIPPLYQPQIQPGILVKGAVLLAMQASKNGNYAQLNPNALSLPGQVDPTIINPQASDFQNFVAQLSFQHVDAYFSLMGIGALIGALNQVRQSAQPQGFQGTVAAMEKKLKRRLAMMALSPVTDVA